METASSRQRCSAKSMDSANTFSNGASKASAAGKRFICSSGFRWLKEISNILRKHFPDYRKKVPSKMMPNFIFKLVSLFDNSAARFRPNLGIRKDFDTRPARELLGWNPRSPDEAIESGARSLIELGIV